MLTLITPVHGNPIALKRTLDSVKGVVDEVVIGDVIVFDEDRELIKSYNEEWGGKIKFVNLPFNYIYKNGFADTLNAISEASTNNLVLYLNVGEIIENGKGEILSRLSDEYNCYYIDHPVETHRWWRFYDKRYLKWSGIIHEEIAGVHRPYPRPIFTFNDTEKDNVDEFKNKILNDVKEIVYFEQYAKLVENPKVIGATNPGWMKFATDGYFSFKERLLKKEEMYDAFIEGDYDKLMNSIHDLKLLVK